MKQMLSVSIIRSAFFMSVFLMGLAGCAPGRPEAAMQTTPQVDPTAVPPTDESTAAHTATPTTTVPAAPTAVPTPALPTVSVSASVSAAPAGLVYRVIDQGLFQINSFNVPRQIPAPENTLVSPDGRFAAFMNAERQLFLFNPTTGSETQLAAEVDLSYFFMWGDSDTLLVGIWLDPSEAEGPNMGHIATLDVPTGALQLLDTERLTGNRPAMSAIDAWVAFDVFGAAPLTGQLYRSDSGLQTFDGASFSGAANIAQDPLFNPAWSPDASQLAWLSSTGERVTLLLFDLPQKTVVPLLDWDPARFGALIPSPVFSPDGNWIALEVWANGVAGTGLWLAPADGREAVLVDPLGGDPVWVSPTQLVYNFDRSGVIHLLDVPSGEILRLDLPPGSFVVSFSAPPIATPASSPAADAPAGETPPLNSLTMTTTTTASPDGRWQASVAQSDPVTVGGGQQFYVTLTVSDGSTTWTPLAEWRNHGLGYIWPEVVRWSADGRLLYFANRAAIDGCGLFLNAVDLYRLDVIGGSVATLLAPHETGAFALSPSTKMLAFVTVDENGRHFLTTQENHIGFDQNGNLINETNPDAGEWHLPLDASNDPIRAGNIVWSPDGSSLLVTVAHNPCNSGWSHSILHVADLEMTTLIDRDARRFTTVEWTTPETARLVDGGGRFWLLDVQTGELLPDE